MLAKLAVTTNLQKHKLIFDDEGMILVRRGRSKKGFEQMGAESRNLSFRKNVISVKSHQIQHLIERISLPFEVVGLKLPQLLLCGNETPMFLEAEG